MTNLKLRESKEQPCSTSTLDDLKRDSDILEKMRDAYNYALLPAENPQGEIAEAMIYNFNRLLGSFEEMASVIEEQGEQQ